MNDTTLTVDERRCLQMWFRQAIAKLERDEATAQFIKEHGVNMAESVGHRETSFIRRRTRRSGRTTHTRELVY